MGEQNAVREQPCLLGLRAHVSRRGTSAYLQFLAQRRLHRLVRRVALLEETGVIADDGRPDQEGRELLFWFAKRERVLSPRRRT